MYKLVKIPPNGRRQDVAADPDPETMILAGTAMQKKFPKEQFGVTDEFGFYLWPERLAKPHLTPVDYDSSKTLVPNRYGSVDQY
jgi:hypothetical protein